MDNTRYSPKRDAILQCLRSTTCHPSAEWVYAQLKPRIPNLSLATVYRNLEAMLARGEVTHGLLLNGESFYEAAGRQAHRHYLVCKGCNARVDLPACPIEQTGGMTRMLLCSAWSTEIARQPISRFFTDGGTMQPYGIS